MTRRSPGTAEGVLAMAAGYGVAYVAGLVTNRPFVANPIADRIMERTPVSLATVLLSGLGVAAKPFALAGALALAAALAAFAGRLLALTAKHGPWQGLALAGVSLSQAGIVALLAGAERAEGAVLPYAVWALVAAKLVRAHKAPEHVNPDRRWFLRRGVQAAGGLVLLSTVATWTLLARTLAGARPGRTLFAFSPPAARDPTFASEDGLMPEVTPVTNFYLMSKTVEDPAVSVDSWRLRIAGLVQRPVEFTYDDLQRLPRVDEWLTLRCVSNPVGGPLMGNALWSGVPLPALLALAGVDSRATTLVMKARDTYSDSIPLDRARLDTTVLAYAMNGALLNRDHGFPARLLVPGLYGFKNVKWVEELQLVAGEFAGPWQRLGWTKTAIQTTFSRIDFVRRTTAGAIAGGIAFAGDRGISTVEVRAGDEPWRPATVQPPLGPLAWVQWLFPFQASGKTSVTVRASDAAGALQEQTERGIFPDGATGWHSVAAEL
jgi:DMSO/TMAO reductase YedYZ molybdopterin-dependent catalytic subunit